jgi:hypothetical protein
MRMSIIMAVASGAIVRAILIMVVACCGIPLGLIVRVTVVVAVAIGTVVRRGAVFVAIAFGVFSGRLVLYRSVFGWRAASEEESGGKEGKKRALHVTWF